MIRPEDGMTCKTCGKLPGIDRTPFDGRCRDCYTAWVDGQAEKRQHAFLEFLRAVAEAEDGIPCTAGRPRLCEFCGQGIACGDTYMGVVDQWGNRWTYCDDCHKMLLNG